MNNLYKIVLDIKSKHSIHIYKAFKPDTLINPPDCNTEINTHNNTVTLTIECKRITLLRALTNSYFSIISMIKHILEELEHESTKYTTGSTTTTSPVSSS